MKRYKTNNLMSQCGKLEHCLAWIVLATAAPTVLSAEEAKADKMTVEYNTPGPNVTHDVTMEGALNALGISLEKIDHVKLKGNEGAGMAGRTRAVKIDDWFWRTYFSRAEPYKFWEASGNHKLEIYLKGEPKPKATIWVNGTDSSYVEGDPRELRYMCYGLYKWISMHLAPETEKQNKPWSSNP